MKTRRFATIEEIKTESLRELMDIPKSAYQKCFEDWKKRWHKCIISAGDYFDFYLHRNSRTNKYFSKKMKIHFIFLTDLVYNLPLGVQNVAPKINHNSSHDILQ